MKMNKIKQLFIISWNDYPDINQRISKYVRAYSQEQAFLIAKKTVDRFIDRHPLIHMVKQEKFNHEPNRPQIIKITFN